MKEQYGDLAVRSLRIDDLTWLEFRAQRLMVWCSEAGLMSRQQGTRLLERVRRDCLSAMLRHHGCCFGAFVDGRFAGLVIADKLGRQGPELRQLMVIPEYSRRGIAAHLVRRGAAWLGGSGRPRLSILDRRTGSPRALELPVPAMDPAPWG